MESAKKITNADRGTFWLLNRKDKFLHTTVKRTDGGSQKIRVEVNRKSFAGQVAEDKKGCNIPYDLYDDANSASAKLADQKTGYRTYSLLCMPVFDTKGDLIGVTQLLNKRRQQSIDREYHLENYPNGEVPDFFKASFSSEDEERLSRFNEHVAIAIKNVRQSVTYEQDDNLYNLLDAAARLASRYLNTHRARIFLVNEETRLNQDEQPRELWSIISEHQDRKSSEISVPIGNEAYTDVLGQVAKAFMDHPQNISLDKMFIEYSSNVVYTDRFLWTSSRQDSKIKYQVFNRFLLPITKSGKESNELLAIIEFINKLKLDRTQDDVSSEEISEEIIDQQGFNVEDKESFEDEHAISIAQLIEAFINVYKPVKQYLASKKLIEARELVLKAVSAGEDNFDQQMELEETVKKAAKELVNAHRCTLWRVDPEDKRTLYAYIPDSEEPDSEEASKKVKVYATVGEGYVGIAANEAIEAIRLRASETTKDTYKFLNIPFDVYKDKSKNCKKAKDTDKRTGYRTCSLLCVPILSSEDNQLLGVIQLVNKIRGGFESEAKNFSGKYENKELPPACFMASFSRKDEQQMKKFNDAVGDILQLIGADQLKQDYLRKYQAVENRV